MGLRDRSIALLGQAFLFLLPLAFLPGFFHTPFVQSKSVVLLGLGIPLWFLSRSREKDAVLLPWRLLFLGALAFGALVSGVRGLPLAEWPRTLLLYITPLLLLELGSGLARSDSARAALFARLPLIGIPVLIVGTLRRLLGWPHFLPDRLDVAVASTIGNSNALAELMAPLVVLALAPLLMGSKALPRRGVQLGLFAALGAFLLWSDSRGGWLAAVVGCGVLIIGGAMQMRGRERRRLLIGTSILVVACGGSILASPGLRERMASVIDLQHATNRVRLLIWGGSVEMIAERPAFGVGAGRFEGAFLPHRRAEEWALSGADSRVDTPHNDVLWIAVELGIPGLLLLALALGWSLRLLRRLGKPPETRAQALSLGAVLAAFASCALVRSPLSHPSGLLVPAILLGTMIPRGERQRPAPGALSSGVSLLLGIGFIAVLGLQLPRWRADHRLHEALLRQSAIQNANRRQDAAALRRLFTEAGETLQIVRNDPFSDSAGVLRAGLAARELSTTKSGLQHAGLAKEAALLPGPELALALAEKSLLARPRLPAAVGLIALLELDQGHVAAAVHRLEDGLKAIPAAPRLRLILADLMASAGLVSRARDLIAEECALGRTPQPEHEALLGEISLRLGSDAKSLGLYLKGSDEGSLDGSRIQALPTAEAKTALLRHLGHHPRDAEALGLLADLIFAKLRGDERSLALANRAVARMRVLWAVGDIARGELPAAKVKLRIAASKDSSLGDTLLLQATIAARENNPEKAQAALDTLLAQGFLPQDLRPFIQANAALRALLASAQLHL